MLGCWEARKLEGKIFFGFVASSLSSLPAYFVIIFFSFEYNMEVPR
jgi:hypothetical protein